MKDQRASSETVEPSIWDRKDVIKAVKSLPPDSWSDEPNTVKRNIWEKVSDVVSDYSLLSDGEEYMSSKKHSLPRYKLTSPKRYSKSMPQKNERKTPQPVIDTPKAIKFLKDAVVRLL